MNLKNYIRSIPDYPKQGIMFRDVTTLLANPDAVRYCAESIAEKYKESRVEKVVVIESRGFVIGSIVAYLLGAGVVLVRKKGKLPFQTFGAKYELEYANDELEIHTDSIKPNERVLLHDDLLATGGTMNATIDLVKQCKGDIVGASFIIELSFLNGKKAISKNVEDITTLVSYENEL